MVADDGTLWVERVRSEGTIGYDVFSPEGTYQASLQSPFVSIPAPHALGDYIAGVVQDSLGVQSVEVYRVVKSD